MKMSKPKKIQYAKVSPDFGSIALCSWQTPWQNALIKKGQVGVYILALISEKCLRVTTHLS